ncbi:type II toxin-antitoxin system RatA family toxin [Rhodobacteraceae bacterium 2376]|uniref:Type II toxin-antitoxin system RatA family toxin n=1 Tax=Rhabdonatronobacter sediminivivens TaxID=2743469 RepID=A0A7Z0KYA6_9RHOB|nr:type II toxin-antitoxin system RatA family toxin [Rhabdonatronobacter sediminivivens]NYS25144.1 type II toxin-antitoxin system RatA family toxin [Rhabdonatronobacter sediminivivens]
MPKHNEYRHMPYSAQQIFDLVADVARYPEFLPWTSAARIRARRPIEGGEEIDADLVISFKVFRERFTSRVQMYPDQGLIKTTYLDGPFKYMHSSWSLRAAEDGGCIVDFHVDFEFRSAMLQRLIGVVFDQAMRRIVAAFEKRARALYGPGGQPAA